MIGLHDKKKEFCDSVDRIKSVFHSIYKNPGLTEEQQLQEFKKSLEYINKFIVNLNLDKKNTKKLQDLQEDISSLDLQQCERLYRKYITMLEKIKSKMKHE